MDANDSIAYLNGDFLPLSKARISPLDRGFIYGDGVYEVMPVYGRRVPLGRSFAATRSQP
jgi:D-alanine transaminase